MITFTGAGHVPYRTHPEAYVEVIDGFMTRHEKAPARATAAAGNGRKPGVESKLRVH